VCVCVCVCVCERERERERGCIWQLYTGHLVEERPGARLWRRAGWGPPNTEAWMVDAAAMVQTKRAQISQEGKGWRGIK
jgi:hypothetical protein